MELTPDSPKNRFLMEPSLPESDSGLVPDLTDCQKLNLVPTGLEQGYPANSTPWSRYRTAGWQRPESCGSRGQYQCTVHSTPLPGRLLWNLPITNGLN